jgi:hypothetical protein
VAQWFLNVPWKATKIEKYFIIQKVFCIRHIRPKQDFINIAKEKSKKKYLWASSRWSKMDEE